MFRNLTAAILSLCLIVLAPQVSAASKTDKAAQTVATGPRRHLTNIIFAGLAGAILGLSTLSFYGRPQDRLSNVPMGAAAGIIIGTIYTTFKAASEPKDFYSVRDPQAELWRLADADRRENMTRTPQTKFTFEF